MKNKKIQMNQNTLKEDQSQVIINNEQTQSRKSVNGEVTVI